MHTLHGIKSYEVDNYWELVRDLIDDSLKYSDGKYTSEDIRRMIFRKEMQLWIVIDIEHTITAAIITQIVNFPCKRVLLFVLVSGSDFDEWKHCLTTFINFAKYSNCHSIEGYGRPGWEKKIRKLGFTKIHTIYRLELNGEN